MRSLLRSTVFALVAVYAFGAWAQNAPRKGKAEFTLSPVYTRNTTINGADNSQADIENSFGFGFGFGYNLNNNVSLGGEFIWGEGDYRATFGGVDSAGNPNGQSVNIKGTMYTSTLRLNATWNMLASDVTPFLQGGLGSTYINTNIPNGPPSNACWWDPWWGYYCSTYYPTKSSTNFSYMAAAGVRWDVNRDFFMRAFVARNWIDVGGSLGTPWIDQYRIDFGFKF